MGQNTRAAKHQGLVTQTAEQTPLGMQNDLHSMYQGESDSIDRKLGLHVANKKRICKHE